jgi:serine/threonine-protein kinase
MDRGQLFLVMEDVPGKDLKEIMKEHGPFTPEQAVPLVIQACAGIGYAHRAGLVHCDVKPQNLLVTPDLRLKVTDFGIARALEAILPDEKNDIVWGSPQYFAPEQAAGGPPSPAADVYSLGVIFFEMLTGKLPFTGSTAEELARQHIQDEPPTLRSVTPGASQALEKILAKVLSKEPSRRYRTADQLGRVLISFGSGEGASRNAPSSHPLAKPVDAQQKTAAEVDWLTVGLGLAALVTVLGLIPFWMWIYFVYNPPIR